MSIEISKSRTKKSLRVATVFTGVAACTAGMAQAANAQDATRADVRPGATHGAIRPGATTGSIRSADGCGDLGIDKTWLHVSVNAYLSSPRPGYITGSTCFGYKGQYFSPPGVGANAECGGNNNGWLVGRKARNSIAIPFTPGTGYYNLNWSHFSTVQIDGWSGGDTCPRAPYFLDYSHW